MTETERTQEVEGLLNSIRDDLLAGTVTDDTLTALGQAKVGVRDLAAERDRLAPSHAWLKHALSEAEAALSRKDAALREIAEGTEWSMTGHVRASEMREVARRALASEPGQEGGDDG